MKLWSALLGSFAMMAAASSVVAQAPVLSTIQAPYAPVQSQVQMAGKTYASGTVAYGAVGTPLVLSGSGLGDNGVVWFIPYKNGTLDTNTPAVQGVVTLWTASQIFLKVPSGAVSGLVEVLTADSISNGLPFVVTQDTYSNSCPAGPSPSQLQITTDSLQNGTTNQSYSAQLTARGGSNSYTWTLASGSLPAGLSLSASGAISGTPAAASNPVSFAVQVVDTSTPPQHDEATLSLEVGAQPEAASSAALYNFSIQTSGGGAEGYDPVGNVTGYTDSVNGTWSFTYDSLNRLATATGSQDNNIYPNYCWNYDSFGDRTMQMNASVPFASSMGGPDLGTQVCSTTGTLGQTIPAPPNANNQISDGLHQYDASGDITQDATTGNSYLYDGEGRICAMQQSIAGTTVMIGYIYNAEGVRVAKGTISTFSCNTTSNGFTATTAYLLGPSGEQMTEMTNNAGTWQWKHTNVYAPGLSATYDADPTGQTEGPMYFHLSDWLGTRRQQTDYTGNPLLNFTGLPYGDGLSTIPVSNTDVADATEHHFTGKERDTESGNDYFGARYYASTMGRFLSPDWASNPQAVPYASYTNPQTLNLYNYMRNNPLSGTDKDGHCCDDGSPQERLLTGIVGGINLYVSVKKGVAAVAEAATSETGVGALAALYTGNQAVNQGAGGIRQIFGAITGNTKDANEYADNLAIHSSIVGTTTLAFTKDKDLAVGATAAEGIASTTVVKKLPEMLDWGLNAFQVLTSAKPKPDTASQQAPAPATQPTPPAPKPPPPPPCNQAGGKC
jgi:RHS repeat-associated protein